MIARPGPDDLPYGNEFLAGIDVPRRTIRKLSMPDPATVRFTLRKTRKTRSNHLK